MERARDMGLSGACPQGLTTFSTGGNNFFNVFLDGILVKNLETDGSENIYVLCNGLIPKVCALQWLIPKG